jgi:hypothetical protein
VENLIVEAFLEKDGKISSTAVESATSDKNGFLELRERIKLVFNNSI